MDVFSYLWRSNASAEKSPEGAAVCTDLLLGEALAGCGASQDSVQQGGGHSRSSSVNKAIHIPPETKLDPALATTMDTASMGNASDAHSSTENAEALQTSAASQDPSRRSPSDARGTDATPSVLPSPGSADQQRAAPMSGASQSEPVAPASEPEHPATHERSPVEEALWMWNAFLAKHRTMTTVLSEVTQLRRACIKVRRLQREYQSERQMDSVPNSPRSRAQSGSESSPPSMSLEAIESRLEQLDEELLREADTMLRAAPRVLSRMQKRMPMMLAKYQLDFRGDTSTSDASSVVEFEEELGPTALELLSKQAQIHDLEDQILLYRHQRNRYEEDARARAGEGRALYNDDQSVLEDLDRKIEAHIGKLKILQDEMEQSRDFPPVADALQPHEPSSPAWSSASVPSRFSGSFSGDNLSIIDPATRNYNHD
ncbi:uncharacterized protein HMPREF1541_02312 [Cyphellophora europaea CBS 101466]|uniref:Uncharacterized protein n=1 Tax=Cyphellophora europaea (strain CBS 101466) TaxID=1220924 RepID=W2S5C1_CYPE1|nr:uncharacterized protein HMPREF1541_02312 [Cyphellophora europaea CBS 101466]ETN43154.1 hypothetical protein HMPREF1541_02312 [Cyphellophora europaea CBS 101466]